MESVIATREEVERFLSIIGSDYGYGCGYCSGCGSGCGSGDGSGNGWGDGSGCGDGCGNGWGDGSGCGDGYGDGYGYGSGDGYGSGYGDGNGSGYGDDDIKALNGDIVDHIDDVPTIITQVRGNIARGYIIKEGLTLDSCYIVKVGNSFAHGKTLKDAVTDAEAKEMKRLPVEERIEKFKEAFGSLDSEHAGKEFYDWHHILTGSCRMGRDKFCESHNIDLSKEYTVRYFLDITKEAYGGDTIKQIIKSFKETYSHE